MPHSLTDRDRRQIAQRGIPEKEIYRQLALQRRPPRPAPLLRPATLGDGLRQLEEDRHPASLAAHARAAQAGRLAKFVPASGAASRMFQPLISVLSGEANPAAQEAVERFLAELDRFPFAGELAAAAPRRDDPIAMLLGTDGLCYLDRPKALIPFHRYGTTTRTPFAEHLAETLAYARGPRCGRLHMTIAPHCRKLFLDHFGQIRRELEASAGSSCDVAFSSQAPSTDTLAVDLEGMPFRLADGTLLFRPGGHGALLWNLDEMSGDVVFIKTVDNVVPEERSGPTLLWKRLLAGHLVLLQEKAFELLGQLETDADGSWLEEGLRFAADELSIVQAQTLLSASADRQRAFLHQALDRPLRVCGMVRNTGEPGGGPFWVRRSDGAESLQIVESVEIDSADPEQKAILDGSTHFNPVDLVCALRNRHGEPYYLPDYSDPACAFIAKKSQEGRPLQALEHPGLWNGGMAFWNTVFVEVPAETFAPVKTVFDLLRPEHQPS